jgi:serine/threonine-protein kinase
MAQPPPRPAARAGGPASPGATPSSSSGPRTKDGDKNGQQPFFLGRYRVVDEIGVGGMASVHLARMDGPGGFQKWVAIKRIHPHLVEDDQFVDMFLDEARIAAGINHANVAQVFDLGKDDNTYWIAMEYLHGEPLREVMRRAEDRGMRIAPELAARICADAAEGLHAAHELRGKNGQLLGLVHRDVTPHNLFVTYDGYTKVVDFGIAKVADRLSSTRAGTLKGKLAYMSPEQVRGAEVDRTTDIFALGVVLWEITTNQRLFRMETDLDTLEKVQNCIVPPPSTIVPGYPLELEACVMKALSKRKQDRYATAREFSRALQSFLVRSGHFVGPEEVAQFVRGVFADRIQKREAHLAWAAEVTGNVSIEQLRAARSAQNAEAEAADPRSRATAPQQQALRQPESASGERPVPRAPPPPQVPLAVAQQSLMDDDEDVPTTVAMREVLEARFAMSGPRPAAGLPAPPPQPPQPQSMVGPSPASYAANASYSANAGGPMSPYGAANNGPSYNAQGQPSAASYAANSASNPYGQQPGFGEHTAALPSPAEDLGSTVALPSTLDPPRSPSFGGQFGGPQPSLGQPTQAFGFAPGGPAPSFPQQQQHQQNPQLTPHGMVGGVPMNLPVSAQPGAPQSQIETSLRLPRPDPAEVWDQIKKKQKGERRNVWVLVSVIAVTAICVISLALLIFFKLRAKNAQATALGAASTAVASAAPSAAPSAPATAAPTATAAATVATPTATATAAAPATAAPKAEPRPAKEEPGYLTIVCSPACDEVFDGSRSLGGTPIVHFAVNPGTHKITLKKGKDTKIMSVIVVSGQVSPLRVPMK